MTNADIYIQKFKELEAVVRDMFGLNDWDSVTNFLSKREEYAPFREEIKYCQEVRNLLQHKPKIEGEYPVEPTDEMISFLQKTVDSLKNRRKCREIMVPKKDVFCRELSDPVRDTIPQMRNIDHNHVPILNDQGAVAGMFTAVSFLRLMADRKDHTMDSETKFSDIEKYISFDSHSTEIYSSVSGEMYVDELEELFESSYAKGKRLSMVFVTEEGRKNGKLLGIISPWDVLCAE